MVKEERDGGGGGRGRERERGRAMVREDRAMDREREIV